MKALSKSPSTGSATRSDAVLATVGDCCIDEYVDLGVRAVGGNAVNVAAAWAQAGHLVSYLGATGPDDDGGLVRTRLVEAGVDVSGVVTLPGNTGVTRISLVDGERHLDEDLGVAVDYRPTAEDLGALAGTRFAHCATLTDFRAVVRDLTALGVRVSYDFSTRHELEDLAGLEVAFFSWEAEPDDAARDVLRRARAAGVQVAVVTCGRHGSLALAGGADAEPEFVPARAIEPIDSCGAGDSYIAAFLSAHLDGRPLRVCMSDATRAATETCLRVGAWPQPGVPQPLTHDHLGEAAHEPR
jgi:fructoselysine 6-kinase